MIDDKKIEAAARRNADKYRNYPTLSDEDRDKVSIGSFMDCAKWMQKEFLKDLWHPNTEEPDKNKSDIITLGFDNNAYLQFKESILWNKESWRHSISRCQIIKWAYLSDILPKDIINNKFDKKK